MTILGRLLESRAIDKNALFGQGADLTIPTAAGIGVDQSSAMRLVVVYACVRLVAETIASLPADVFRKAPDGSRREVTPGPMWLREPNPETTWFEFVERIGSSLETAGNAYIIITRRNATSGYPEEIWTLHPDDVTVLRRSGRIVYRWGTRELERYSVSTPRGEVLHLKNFSTGGLLGLSPIEMARQAIGLGLAAERFGSEFFGQGQTLSGVIELEADTAPKAQASIDAIRENWAKRHSGVGKAHLPGVLVNAKWTPIAIPPEQAQFLETRKFQVSEIARLFRVPPHMVGDVERSTSWGTGIEQQSIGWVQFSIDPRLARLEHYFNQLLPRGQFVKWNTKGLLRGDSKAQADWFAAGRQWGYLTPNRILALQDEPPIEGDYGDSYLIPAGYTVATPGGTDES